MGFTWDLWDEIKIDPEKWWEVGRRSGFRNWGSPVFSFRGERTLNFQGKLHMLTCLTLGMISDHTPRTISAGLVHLKIHPANWNPFQIIWTFKTSFFRLPSRENFPGKGFFHWYINQQIADWGKIPPSAGWNFKLNVFIITNFCGQWRYMWKAIAWQFCVFVTFLGMVKTWPLQWL